MEVGYERSAGQLGWSRNFKTAEMRTMLAERLSQGAEA